mmetsp:Transcript_61050/g.189275  ORF Transcript_61050/g.189275 Transcript_61050/m.189275 type:complete len:234 (+) Transcript_61050:203-904(+)
MSARGIGGAAGPGCVRVQGCRQPIAREAGRVAGSLQPRIPGRASIARWPRRIAGPMCVGVVGARLPMRPLRIAGLLLLGRFARRLRRVDGRPLRVPRVQAVGVARGGPAASRGRARRVPRRIGAVGPSSLRTPYLRVGVAGAARPVARRRERVGAVFRGSVLALPRRPPLRGGGAAVGGVAALLAPFLLPALLVLAPPAPGARLAGLVLPALPLVAGRAGPAGLGFGASRAAP